MIKQKKNLCQHNSDNKLYCNIDKPQIQYYVTAKALVADHTLADGLDVFETHRRWPTILVTQLIAQTLTLKTLLYSK